MNMAKVATADAVRFMSDCLKAVGTAALAADQQAELLIAADRMGHPSHGLNRLEFYVNDILSGACKPNNQPKVLKESPSTAWVDANHVLGATASHFAMDIAIQKAKTTGVGWVTVKGSNHNGMAGFWAKKAAENGCIGMAFTNTSPLMAPTRSKQAALGTNPISVVAPASNNETFYLDMATTAVAVGKIEMQRRKGEPIPKGWAQGPDGNPTTDAEVGFKTGCLYPLGGLEETSGYKGYGLGAVVELLCGISSGSKYGHHIRKWSHSGDGGPADLGHCFIAVDIGCFAPGFEDRLADCMDHWRQLESADPSLPVLAPGDKERMQAKRCDEQGTVSYVQQQIEASATLAKKLNVQPMENMARVAIKESMRFMSECLKVAGAPAAAANQQAELLIAADRMGHFNQGLSKLEYHVNDILSGACKPYNQPKVLKESPSTAWVDANHVLGATASHFAMDIAIQKAKDTGVGWVTVKGSNYNGMVGYWAMKAADMGCIGIAFSNATPSMVPTGSKQTALGTNPLAVAAPGAKNEMFFLDMTTTAVDVGKLEMQLRKGESLPIGWAQGPDGNPTTNPHVALNTGCLYPLGGLEETGGFKGYGLGAVVELLCGISSGSEYGHHIRGVSHNGEPVNLGQCFIAVDIECLMPGFGDRLTECMENWRQLEPVDPHLPVLAPGDKEKMHAKICDNNYWTVPYDHQQMEASAKLAKKLLVKPLVVTKESKWRIFKLFD